MKYGDTFEIEVPYGMPISNKVSVIKAIRYLTGLGLKESKDIVDTAGKYTLDFKGVDAHSFDQQKYFDDQSSVLLTNGISVHGYHGKILQELRQLAAQAMEQAEDELANEILQLVLAEKLKRQ